MNDYWRKVFGWSASRQRTWDQCRRKYYYSYIGKWEGFKGDLNREKLQWLNRKKCWYMVEGSLIHEAIEGQINQWAVGRPVSKEAARNLFSFRLREIRTAPREFLVDEINGSHIDAEKFERCSRSGTELLDRFFDIIWPNYEPLDYVRHEEFDSFDVDGVRIWTKVDLVTKMSDGTIVVTDWKTGKPGESEENEDQLATYILWAMSKFHVDVGSVRGEIRYLKDPSGKPMLVQADRTQLQRLKDTIASGSRMMLSVASAADFPSTPSDKACVQCQFATICPDGQKHIPTQSQTPTIPIVDK